MSTADFRGAAHAFKTWMQLAKRDCHDPEGEIRPAKREGVSVMEREEQQTEEQETTPSEQVSDQADGASSEPAADEPAQEPA